MMQSLGERFLFGKNSSSISSSKEDEMSLKEWEEARNVLSEFDERAHDLRKFGFTFVTGLLTAEALLITGPAAAVADTVKLAVMLGTLVLIVALRLVERYYKVFQEAASIRARIIETRLNLELTDVIADRYRFRRGFSQENFVDATYLGFAIVVLVLGYSILPRYLANILPIVALIALSAVRYAIVLSYPYGREDWTLDRLECKKGQKIRITLTNLDHKKSISFPDPHTGKLVCTIKKADCEEGFYPINAKIDVSIAPLNNYTWLWDTSGVQSGIYRVVPRKWNEPLRRKIQVA
jgi:hypothetical protein